MNLASGVEGRERQRQRQARHLRSAGSHLGRPHRLCQISSGKSKLKNANGPNKLFICPEEKTVALPMMLPSSVNNFILAENIQPTPWWSMSIAS